nr:uncharacterized protein CTRU02_14365 [Colletotrichum truncatum]KAF6782326.1 hypothetical protein CTRU02_14365 [Colletotrichum truncatum]
MLEVNLLLRLGSRTTRTTAPGKGGHPSRRMAGGIDDRPQSGPDSAPAAGRWVRGAKGPRDADPKADGKANSVLQSVLAHRSHGR